MKLLTVEDARSRMLSGLTALAPETISLGDGLGRVLAEDISATRTQPPFAASSMDGWAVRSADGAGARRIIGESAAGHGFSGVLDAGEAVRIFTGAAVPDGADTVVIQEDARREGGCVVVGAQTPGTNIRLAGKDFAAGTILLRAGMGLDPWRLALAAAAGRARITVTRRPLVTILSTGDEVVAPGGSPGPLQIYDSGATALAALATQWGAIAGALIQAPDDEISIAAAVASSGGDLVVTLGGASVGDHDLVKPALGRLGLRLAVESVAIKPGKPTWFGRLGDGRPVLGLPGNPASALVCAELFLRPLLRAFQGANPAPRLSAARLDAPLKANGEREHWMRARLSGDQSGTLGVAPLSDQDSSLVTVFAEADALLRRPAGAGAAAAGDVVEILRLDRF